MHDGMSRVSDKHRCTFSLYWFLGFVGFLRFFIARGLGLFWGSVNLDGFGQFRLFYFYNLFGFGRVLVYFWLGHFPSV